MEKNPTKNAFTNLLILVATGLGALVVSARGGSLTGLMTSIFCGLGVLVTIVSYLQMRHYRSEEVERLELDKVQNQESSVTLFEGGEDVLRAKRAREQFEKFFIPGWTIMLLLVEGIGAYFLLKFLSRYDIKDPNKGWAFIQAAFFIGFALAQYLFGKYSVGLAQYDGTRMLRPGGSFLMLASIMSVLTAVSSVTGLFGFVKFDLYAARVMGAFLAFLTLETLIILIMEIYRPRVRGREIQLLYESRVVGLLGQPGGIIKTVAHTLDYQFGFKVSDTWFYRYVERAFVWLILLFASVFMVSSCFVVLEPHEQALLERFGKQVKVLEPGLWVKAPWPIDKVYRYSSRAVNQFHIGYVPDPELEKNPVLVWTKKHSAEEFNMLVASRDTVEDMGGDSEADKIVPVNLLTASIPVQYQITDVEKWARNHEDAATLLERIAWREVSRYLVSVDLMDIMAEGRTRASQELRDLIQAESDRLKMGCTISFVGLQDIHPPIQVAGAYEMVVGALQEKEKRILDAQAYQVETVPAAHAQAFETVQGAEAFKVSRVTSAAAESGQFANQVKAFSAAPDVYKRRVYLKTVAESMSGARKYILGTTNTQDILFLKLDDSIGSEYTDVTFNEDTEKAQQQSQQ